MKPVKISQKDYDKWAVYPQIKQLMDQSIAAGLLVIKDVPQPPAPVPEPVPPAGPAPAKPSRPIFIGLTRHWSKESPATTADVIAAAGGSGMSLELIELEPSSINSPAKMTDYLLAQVRKAVPYAAELRKRGLLIKLYGFNSNAAAGAQPSLAQHKQIIDEWAKRIGWRGVYVMWSNEDDANQPASTRDGASKYARQSMVAEIGEAATAIQTIAYNRPAAGSKLVEYHPQSVGAWPSPGSGSVIAPDNGGPLRDLGSYIGTERPNIQKWTAFAKTAAAKGYGMLDAYNFNTKLDASWVKAVVAAWGSSAKPQPQNPTADAIDISNLIESSTGNVIDEQKIPITHAVKNLRRDGDRISFTNDFPKSWFGPNHATVVTDLGRCYCYWIQDGKTFGGHFDWFRPTSTVKGLENCFGPYFKIRPPKSAQLYFAMVSSDKKNRTAVVKG